MNGLQQGYPLSPLLFNLASEYALRRVEEFRYLGTTLLYQIPLTKNLSVRECLISFGAESFVFLFAIQKYKIKVYRTIILPVVLYEYETWWLTLREENSVRVFENRVLRRIFCPK
jgi:hypothetical protein